MVIRAEGLTVTTFVSTAAAKINSINTHRRLMTSSLTLFSELFSMMIRFSR
jgi:hypothetical protein